MIGPAYRVLGQVSLTVEGRETVLSRCRLRELLALLVAAGGRPVSPDRVHEELWGGDVAWSPGPVQVAVSRLRTLIDPTRSGDVAVQTTPAGYRLLASAADVDAWAFSTTAERALDAETPQERLVLATGACRLWTGTAYAECVAPAARAESARLADLHLALQESRARALVALGHAEEAVRVLPPLAPAEPYREPLWALLAWAQYASSRQADALATLATLRLRLVEDLRVDPSAEVRATERRILTQEAGIAPAPRPRHGGRRVVRPRLCRAASVTAGLHTVG